MSEQHYDEEFIRDETTIDRDFTIVANRWITDQRIVGNSLSVYLWIRAQAPGFKVGRGVIMNALGLGKGAFATAIARLEEAGYLARLVDRWPAGTRTADGRQLGGARRVRFQVLEPGLTKPSTPEAPEHAPMSDDPVLEGEEPHEINEVEPKAENAPRVIHRPKPKAENAPRVIHRSEPGEDDSRANTGKPNPKHPTLGFPPLNKTKDKQNKSSSSVSNQKTATADFGIDDDDDSNSPRPVHAAPSRNAFGVDEQELRIALSAAFGAERVARLDLTEVSVTVLGRSAQRRVAHPTRFVLSAVLNAPQEFLAVDPEQTAPAPDAGTASPGLPDELQAAVGRLCATNGHQWHRRDTQSAVCHRCGLDADDIPASVRADCAARTAGAHVLGGQQLCRTCGHDDLTEFHASTRKAG